MQVSSRTIGEVIDHAPISRLQWRVVVLCTLVAMIDGFDMQVIAFAAPALVEEIALPTAQLGAVFSAALVGLMFGAFLGSPLADRVGRKPVIIASCLLMGLFSLLTATAEQIEVLMLYRFLTGIGLGGAMPNINALTAEMVPARRRAFLMTLMFVGFSVGAVLGGAVSAPLIHSYGWQSLFVLGGVLPIILGIFLVRQLPESLRWLALRRPWDSRIPRYAELIRPGATLLPSRPTGERGREAVSIAVLFRDGMVFITVTLWTLYFLNLLLLYSLANWLPMLMKQAGFALEHSMAAVVVFNLGGILGGLGLAAGIDRYGPVPGLALGYLVATLSVLGVAASSDSLAIMLSMVFCAGIGVVGGQFCLNAVVAGLYPTAARATGLGWALAVGRAGSILGPVLTGLLVVRLQLGEMFTAASLPAAGCFVVVLLLARILRGRGQ